MTKKLLWALLLIALSVLVLILNTRGSVSVALLPKIEIDTLKSIAFLVFIADGVAIGLLLK